MNNKIYKMTISLDSGEKSYLAVKIGENEEVKCEDDAILYLKGKGISLLEQLLKDTGKFGSYTGGLYILFESGSDEDSLDYLDSEDVDDIDEIFESNKSADKVQDVKGMKLQLNSEILNVCHAVISYRKFLIDDNRVTKKVPVENFDFDKIAENYYYSLPLPKGMRKNKMTYERITGLGWLNKSELEKWDASEFSELPNYLFIEY